MTESGKSGAAAEQRERPGRCVLRHALVAFVCAAEILGLAGFSLVPALLPQFIATWSLSNAEAGWLAGMMSGGYMVGVLPLVALTDRVPARTIFLVCSALSALSCFGIALSDGLPMALVWRAVGCCLNQAPGCCLNQAPSIVTRATLAGHPTILRDQGNVPIASARCCLEPAIEETMRGRRC